MDNIIINGKVERSEENLQIEMANFSVGKHVSWLSLILLFLSSNTGKNIEIILKVK